MNPQAGAFRHINIGVKELNKHFTMTSLLPEVTEAPDPPVREEVSIPKESPEEKRTLLSKLKGTARDLLHLAKLTNTSLRLSRKIRTMGPDFVYVRANFLDPLPLLLKAIKIPCFIESNGLLFESRVSYYGSFFNPIAKFFERQVYASSAHAFFVGSYGHFWRLPKSNWSNTENGVESSLVEHFCHPRTPPKFPLKLCFLGNLRGYHRPDLLIQALGHLPKSLPLEIHLIGANLSALENELAPLFRTFNHGFLSREELPEILKNFDVGIIPGAPQFASQMKLLDYGGARMAVIAPDLKHFKNCFRKNELSFFTQQNSASLAASIEALVTNPAQIADFGNQLHEKIKREYTWEKIFSQKSKVIESYLQRVQ